MKKFFLGLLFAVAAMICVAPTQQLSASNHVYGSFYTTQTGTLIPVNGSVPFDVVAVETDGVKIDGGNISIKHKGDYLVTYAVAITSTSFNPPFQLNLNGAFIPGTQQPQGADLYHPFTTIVHVTEKNSILSVINLTTGVSLSQTQIGDTTAYITVLKLN